MDERYADPDVITRLLEKSRTWAFVGLANRPHRTVYDQARRLQARGKRIIPVHPDREVVLGERAYGSLAEIPEDVTIDVVGVYRRSQFAGGVIDEAIARGAGAVWLPLGVVDEAAAERALAAGLDVVMDRCPAIEWSLRH
ncbi:CoA-binding protein [Thermomonospora catenispora]|uniref:CoA-binding protein n=1 Tax=Thermomonospora catenispora TaxID=2493090 RepID=UPI00111EDA3B|nr:CoA-binding protein [Thermomonospora catenispora]TNY38645.1 CoA-binding protein [Thermomonospora catenispora]